MMTDNGRLQSLRIKVLAEDSVGYETPYLGQHGTAFLLVCRQGGVAKNILVDVAQNPEALLQNFERMGVAPGCVDAIVLTHCHYDHTQGLARVLRAIGKKDLPVIAHPALFRFNFITRPFLRHVGVMSGDSRRQIEASGGMLFLTKDPLEIMPGLTTTGEVERTTDFEKVGISLTTIEAGRLQPDAMPDDLSVVARIQGRGLFIVTGCSHAGIVNIARQAIRQTGTERICGILGGLHLVEASENRIQKTVQALHELGPESIWAGHCTGFRAQAALYQRFGERFQPLFTGLTVAVGE
jgi:7,8-dihydropterin-6-yl-methyl-4-(beta-D-ribofuranosyl)aminobenzene 5'-phosphate synthase